ncbi:MAG UNVERIFIED_CONTAM: hypothetical protein LVR18_40980 [Planctomycetaceae bacterium]
MRLSRSFALPAAAFCQKVNANDRPPFGIQYEWPQKKPLVELAKERRSAIAAQRMRSAGELRPDVLMYLTGALERFAGMSLDQIQALDINDPEPKYTLRSLPGTFSGLHLCCLMYAAFKKFAAAQDMGIDFSRGLTESSVGELQELRSLRPIEESTPYSVLSFCSHQLRVITAGSIS